MASRTFFLCFLLALVLLTSRLQVTIGINLTLGFHEEPKDVIAEKNHPLLINCSAFSDREFEPLNITWRHNGLQINDSRRWVLSNGSLYFQRVIQKKKNGEDDSGLYYCVASNSIGSLVSKPIQLNISYMSRNFSLDPQLLQIEEGETARFSCQITAVPEPLFTWEKNRRQLPQNDDRIIVLKKEGILLIKDVLKSDTGKYRCIATSGASRRKSTEATLEVLAAEVPKENTLPEVITPHRTITAIANQEVTLECTATGYPKPTIEWQRKDQILDQHRVLQSAHGHLIFHHVQQEDEGTYVCTATNKDPDTEEARSATQSFVLNVLVPPVFLKQPQSQIVPSVQTVRFECDVQGSPPPTVKWLKNGQSIPNSGRIKIKNNSNYELVILTTVSNDSGIYQCMADNVAGHAVASARLQISTSEDQPDPPTGLKAHTLSSTSIELLWNASTSRNGLEIQAYTVHYAPTQGGGELQKVAVSPSQIIEKLKPFTNFTFYVRAYNGKSASDQSETIVWSTGEDVPISAPKVCLKSTSATNLLVIWHELSNDLARGVIQNYKIQWRLSKPENNNYRHIQDVPGDIREYTITGLEPGSKYEVRVIGSTNAGYPNLTDEDWPWVRHEMPQKPEEVPLPPILDLLVINATVIKVKWQIPEDNEYEIEGFKLSFRKQNHKLGDPIVIPNNETDQYILYDLVPQTWYEVHILAYNKKGDGQESVKKISTFPEDLALKIEPPSHLEALPINSTSINVAWRGPNTMRNITFYTLRYNVVSGSNFANSSTVKYMKSTSKKVLVTDLMPFTVYEFSVSSHDQNNTQGPFSDKVECRTQEDIPSAPVDLNWLHPDANSVSLTWKCPSNPNGVIVVYYVMYTTEKKEDCQLNSWITKEEKGTELSTVVNGLSSSTTYYFCLRAKTRAGIGPPSNIISLKIPAAPFKNSTHFMTKNVGQDQRLGIIVGLSIGISCVILCIIFYIIKFRCSSTTLEPSHTYIHHHGNGHVPHVHCNGQIHSEHRLSSSESHEMESFIPMLSNMSETVNSHLDTKGGYPLPLTNGKTNGIKYPFYHNGYIANGHAVKDKPTINITENPQFDLNDGSSIIQDTSWYTGNKRYCERAEDDDAPPSPLLEGEDDALSEQSQNEDSGVQMAPSQETGSVNHDTHSLHSSECELSSATVAAANLDQGLPSSGAIRRPRSWGTLLQHTEALHAHPS